MSVAYTSETAREQGRGVNGAQRAWRVVRRLPGRGVLLLLRAYQLVISPMTPPSCRFYPSCSEYAVRAVRIHGVLKGGRLAIWRVLRCNPWNYGGVDDVPGDVRRPAVQETGSRTPEAPTHVCAAAEKPACMELS
ncbi:membrane protein insertion efficiency factor YidD [Sanguibacter sp. A247]|uniref:membrane protein insertion efficiency factor YidD n=1 Tax=unclassified Sanguibacter TaxID=2645534 RepID=UPI003FD781D3